RRRSERHRALCCRNMAEQLARIRDARVARDVGLHRGHAVERLERLCIAAELELGVADHAVDAGGGRRDGVRTPSESQRKPESMTRERELAEACGRDEVAMLERERL